MKHTPTVVPAVKAMAQPLQKKIQKSFKSPPAVGTRGGTTTMTPSTAAPKSSTPSSSWQQQLKNGKDVSARGDGVSTRTSTPREEGTILPTLSTSSSSALRNTVSSPPKRLPTKPLSKKLHKSETSATPSATASQVNVLPTVPVPNRPRTGTVGTLKTTRCSSSPFPSLPVLPLHAKTAATKPRTPVVEPTVRPASKPRSQPVMHANISAAVPRKSLTPMSSRPAVVSKPVRAPASSSQTKRSVHAKQFHLVIPLISTAECIFFRKTFQWDV